MGAPVDSCNHLCPVCDGQEQAQLPSGDEPWADQPLPEDADIRAAHHSRTGRHDLYAEASRMVGAKRSKQALVELVNWLLNHTHGNETEKDA